MTTDQEKLEIEVSKLTRSLEVLLELETLVRSVDLPANAAGRQVQKKLDDLDRLRAVSALTEAPRGP